MFAELIKQLHYSLRDNWAYAFLVLISQVVLLLKIPYFYIENYRNYIIESNY